MAQIDSLWIQQLLVDGIVKGEVMLFDGFPKLRRILFAEEHDRSSRTRAQVVRFLDAMHVQVVQVVAFTVKLDEVLDGVVRIVNC